MLNCKMKWLMKDVFFNIQNVLSEIIQLNVYIKKNKCRSYEIVYKIVVEIKYHVIKMIMINWSKNKCKNRITNKSRQDNLNFFYFLTFSLTSKLKINLIICFQNWFLRAFSFCLLQIKKKNSILKNDCIE